MKSILKTKRIQVFRNVKIKWAFITPFIILSTLILSLNTHAQMNDITFQRISLEQGLSQSIVTSIVQDSRGFMWFGTEDGLNIYDGFGFEVIRNDPNDPNSLSYNQITTIYEDRSGEFWIGTFNGGLNRYNIKTEQFTRYQNDPNNPNSLSHNIVRAIYKDSDGILWIGTDSGLNRFIPNSKENGNGESGPTFVHCQNDPDNPNSLSHNTVRTIYEDRSGTLWIGTNGGLNQLVKNSSKSSQKDCVPFFVHYKNDPNNPNSLSQDTIRTIYEDRSGTLWIGTEGGLNKLIRKSYKNGQKESVPTFIRYQNDPNNPNSLSNDEIYSIYEDRSGVLWIGTNGGGLDRFDREIEKFTHYQNDPRNPNSLSYNEIRSIFEDRSGNLWIGTYGGGINKVDRGKKQFLHYKPDHDNPNSLNEEIIWGIYEDRSGILWIGTHGGGLNKFDRKNNLYTHYLSDPNDPNSLSNNTVRLVIEDTSGILWIGTNGGGINRFDRESEKFTAYQHDPDNPSSLSHNEIRALYQDRSGTLWIGTRGGGLNKLIPGRHEGAPPTFIHYRYDPDDPNSLSNDFIRTIHEDSLGILWIGTLGGGLNRFDRKSEIFTHYRTNPNDSNSLSNDYIFSIHEDHEGILWLGTFGGGLNKFYSSDGTFKYYTEKDGLPNDVIYGILEDDQHNLWLSTNNGLSKFNPKMETFRNYNMGDGLQSNEFNGGSYFKSGRSGEMFFGGINGFNAFYPENIKDNPYIPPIVITSFRKLNEEVKFNKPISEIKELKLSYRDYVFSFEFAALDYTAPEKNRYAYKMEGLDKEWIYTDSEKRFANYTTLSPGKYTFKVKGSNNDGIWNEKGTSIIIKITPPLWKTLWFRTLFILFVSGFLFILYKRRFKNIRLKTELQAAHDAQMFIMPQADPKVKGFDISGVCIPANEVGGDFFDYIWLNGETDKFVIVIGDVSGKAMKAAMTAVMASGMINTEAIEATSVKKIITRVNRPLYVKTERQMFTSVCLASFDNVKKELTFTNAGLIEPLLKSENTTEYIKATGPTQPLGLIKDNIYQEKKVPLKSGDTLILLTDGITEAINHAKDFYGEEKLKNLINKIDTTILSAKEIIDIIIKDVRQFTGTAQQHDDMTLVVVNVM